MPQKAIHHSTHPSAGRPSASNGTTPIKRERRTKADIARLEDGIVRICEEHHRLSLRHLFYLAVSEGLIEKDEKQYKAIARLSLRLRRQERIPYGWFADGTRWRNKPESFSNLQAAIQNTAEYYRRDLWVHQADYVEIWTEKDAIASILSEVTREYDVSLMVSRGFASETFLYSTAEEIKATGKPSFIYFFADHDPSGRHITESITRRLREFGAVVTTKTISVTPEQIRRWNLPTRPTKQSNHSAGFKGRSVEIDAIPPEKLRGLVRECIERHIDSDQLRRTQEIEEIERRTLKGIAERWPGTEEVRR